VSQVANKIWYIDDHQIKEYPGTYDEYEYWRKNKPAAKVDTIEKKIFKPKPEPKPVAPNSQKKLADLNKELKKVEELIQTLQVDKQKVENELTLPEVYGNFQKLGEVQQRFEKVNQQLADQNRRWEKLALEIDELEGAAS